MLLFRKMTLCNFGPYEHEELDFRDGKGVFIIWGDNGNGKSTILNAFRYALFGYFLYRKEVVEDVHMLVNTDGYDRGEYEFKVILEMINDGKLYELTRLAKPRDGASLPPKKEDYVEECFLKIDHQIVSDAKHELALIMPEEISRFFLFDTELMEEYTELVKEGSASGDIIKQSIESILGVPILENAERDALDALDEYTNRQFKVGKKNKATAEYASIIANETEMKNEQVKHLNDLKEERDQFIKQKNQLEQADEDNEYVNSLVNEKNNLERSIAEKEEEHDALQKQVTDLTGAAWKYVLKDRVNDLKTQLNTELNELQDKQKKQETVEQVTAYYQKIIAEHHCAFCDQDVDEAHVDAIKNKWDGNQFDGEKLTEDEKRHMFDLQVKISDIKELDYPSEVQGLKMCEDRLDALKKNINAEKFQLNKVTKKIEEQGNVDELTANTKNRAKELGKCYQKIENDKEKIQETEQIIREHDSLIKKYSEKLQKAGGSDAELNLVNKQVEFCSLLKDLFQNGIDAYCDQLRKKVEQDATQFFLATSEEPQYTGLKINDNYGLTILMDSGDPARLPSMGYDQVVALSLVGALHKNAPLQGPIIIDMPFGRIDNGHKKNMLTTLPQMSDQIILFAMGSELDDQVAKETLGKKLKHEFILHHISATKTTID